MPSLPTVGRALRRLVPLTFPLGALAMLGVAACTSESLTTQPEAAVPTAEPVDAAPASYVANLWYVKAAMPTARRGLVTATVDGVLSGPRCGSVPGGIDPGSRRAYGYCVTDPYPPSAACR